jgi:hypothetical protein
LHRPPRRRRAAQTQQEGAPGVSAGDVIGLTADRRDLRSPRYGEPITPFSLMACRVRPPCGRPPIAQRPMPRPRLGIDLCDRSSPGIGVDPPTRRLGRGRLVSDARP